MIASDISAAVCIGVVVAIIILVVWLVAVRPEWGHVNYFKAVFTDGPDEVLDRSNGTFDKAARMALVRSVRGKKIHQGDDRLQDLRRISHILRTRLRPAAAFGQFPLHTSVDEINQDIRRTDNEIAQEVRDAHISPQLALDSIEYLLYGTEGGEGDLAMQMTILESAKTAHNQRAKAEQKPHETRGGFVGDFIGNAQRHTNDRENSHDTNVVKSIQHIVHALKENVVRKYNIASIRKYITDHGDDLSRDTRTGRPRILLVSDYVIPFLNRLELGEKIMSIDMSDMEVALLVWNRSYHPKNKLVGEQMRQAFFDAAVDAWKPGISGKTLVCVQGRIARLLGSLTLLDFDKRTWSIERNEDVRNELLNAAKEGIFKQAKLLMDDDSKPSGIRFAAGEYWASSADEMELVRRKFSSCSPEDEASVSESLREAAELCIDAAADAANSRVPNIAPELMVASAKKDACFAL